MQTPIINFLQVSSTYHPALTGDRAKTTGIKNDLRPLGQTSVAHDGRKSRRRFTMLAASVALLAAAAVLPAGSAGATGKLGFKARASVSQQGTLFIRYDGRITRKTAGHLRRIFRKYGPSSYRVILILNSGGGSVVGGERAIHVLQMIKRTHRLSTAVMPGRRCGSMCVPIFLQGQQRYAARTSIFLLHEVTGRLRNGRKVTKPGETMRLFRRYYLPAGVSVKWLNAILPKLKNSNYWFSGRDLLENKTGVITDVLKSNRRRAGLAKTPRAF